MQFHLDFRRERERVRICDLFLLHKEVRRKPLGRYVSRLLRGDILDPVTITYCRHMSRHHVDDGHHRTVAHHLCSRLDIEADVRDCDWYPSLYHEGIVYRFSERIIL